MTDQIRSDQTRPDQTRPDTFGATQAALSTLALQWLNSVEASTNATGRRNPVHAQTKCLFRNSRGRSESGYFEVMRPMMMRGPRNRVIVTPCRIGDFSPYYVRVVAGEQDEGGRGPGLYLYTVGRTLVTRDKRRAGRPLGLFFRSSVVTQNQNVDPPSSRFPHRVKNMSRKLSRIDKKTGINPVPKTNPRQKAPPS
jgi:hypothetical protein